MKLFLLSAIFFQNFFKIYIFGVTAIDLGRFCLGLLLALGGLFRRLVCLFLEYEHWTDVDEDFEETKTKENVEQFY